MPGTKINEQHFLAKDNKPGLPLPDLPSFTTSPQPFLTPFVQHIRMPLLAGKRCTDVEGHNCGGPLSPFLHTNTVTLSYISNSAEFFTFCLWLWTPQETISLRLCSPCGVLQGVLGWGGICVSKNLLSNWCFYCLKTATSSFGINLLWAFTLCLSQSLKLCQGLKE